MKHVAVCFGLALFAANSVAAEVPVEVKSLGNQQVTLHLHDFLTPEENATLQLVATNDEALKLFVTRPGRHAAMAVAPGDGFIRNGQPVASAIALSDLKDAETARRDVLAACNAARSQGPDCVIVMEVAPLR